MNMLIPKVVEHECIVRANPKALGFLTRELTTQNL